MAELVFNEKEHAYYLGVKKLISVTQLLSKHRLAPNYSGIAPEVLERAASKGTLVHKEIEDFIKEGAIGFSKEFASFFKAKEEGLIKVKGCEFKVYNDIVAGTADLLLLDQDELIIADNKTTSSLHYESVSWQLSIYAYLYNLNAAIKVSTKRGKVLHFQKDGSLKIIDINLKPVSEVERLLNCERNGVEFTQELVFPKQELQELYEVESLIMNIEQQAKELKAKQSTLKEALIKAMEVNGLKQYSNDKISLTYVASYKKSSIDSTRLKKEHPDIAAKFTKETNVKASVKITIKEVA